MPPRIATLVRLALALAVLVGAAGCKKGDGTPESPTGAWRSTDPAGVLLLRVFPNDQVQWFFAAGGGSCVYLASGTIDEEEGVLVSEFDDEYPYVVADGVLEIDDPTDQLGGTFERVDADDVCFVNVPALDVQSDRVETLALGDAVAVQGGVGNEVTFDVPADAVSFGLYLFGDPVGRRAAFGALLAPDGTDVLDEESEAPGDAESDIQFCTVGFCSLVVPKQTTVMPSEGTWTAIVVANTADDLAQVSVRGIVREGPLADTTFVVRPFLTTNVVPGADIADALANVAALFDGMYGITLDVQPIETLGTAEDDLVQDFLQPDTAAVMANGDPEAINLFFARRLLGVGGLLGIASGIPASHGVAGPFDGLLVHLENHRDGTGELMTTLLEETIAHEMGHMLGLFHPTEADASFFDPIDDTLECPLADPSPLTDANDHDLDMDGIVYADECIDAGGDNLMFWTPGTTSGDPIVQRTLTSDQVFVVTRSVVGR